MREHPAGSISADGPIQPFAVEALAKVLHHLVNSPACAVASRMWMFESMSMRVSHLQG